MENVLTKYDSSSSSIAIVRRRGRVVLSADLFVVLSGGRQEKNEHAASNWSSISSSYCCEVDHVLQEIVKQPLDHASYMCHVDDIVRLGRGAAEGAAVPTLFLFLGPLFRIQLVLRVAIGVILSPLFSLRPDLGIFKRDPLVYRKNESPASRIYAKSSPESG